MSAPGVNAVQIGFLFGALVLAGVVTTAFVVAYAIKAPWWKHRDGRANLMGRALMALAITWSAELDTTILFRLWHAPIDLGVTVATAIHLVVAAAAVNLLWLLFNPSPAGADRQRQIKEGSP